MPGISRLSSSLSAKEYLRLKKYGAGRWRYDRVASEDQNDGMNEETKKKLLATANLTP
jgi:hypothetical protein